jgi:hypothetical protein
MNMSTTDLLTAALVIITAAYAGLTYGIMRANRRSVAAMEQQTEALSRPYITVAPFTLPKNPILFLRIVNAGNTAAQRVRLELDRPYYRLGRAEQTENLMTFAAFSQVIASVAPTAEFIFALAMAPALFGDGVDEAKTPLSFKVTATYGFAGKVVTEVTDVDLRPFRGMHMAYDPVVNELSEIKDILEAKV